ncbi:uncharacterized protein DMENIID0001_112930 [Sergentomyia squamirostris]
MPAAEWVVNKTDVEIPNEVKTLLGMSPKFGLPLKSLNKRSVLHMLAQTEDALGVLEKNEDLQLKYNIQVPPDYIMISLDVVALFPNIPRQLALDIAKEQWDIIKEHTPIGMNLFMSILKHCLEHSRFVYNGQNYMQIDGMPMGGPLSPIIADLVMNYALTKITQKLNVNILCLTKYVDDIFCLVPKDKVAYIQESFNAFHPKLQFTVELEKENSIAFLDTYVTRRETKLVSIWYKKPIASDRMLNYFSNHTLTQKIATAIGFIKRSPVLTPSVCLPDTMLTSSTTTVPREFIAPPPDSWAAELHRKASSMVPWGWNSTRETELLGS